MVRFFVSVSNRWIWSSLLAHVFPSCMIPGPSNAVWKNILLGRHSVDHYAAISAFTIRMATRAIRNYSCFPSSWIEWFWQITKKMRCSFWGLPLEVNTKSFVLYWQEIVRWWWRSYTLFVNPKITYINSI